MTHTNSIEQALHSLQQGKMVAVFDHESRENEGDLILSAEKVTASALNFMLTYARGLICLSLTPKQVEHLQLPLMIEKPQCLSSCSFTVSVDAASGITTGISASDRAHTIEIASNPNSTIQDITMPGHVFPLKAKAGGVLERIGHTEASLELMHYAKLRPAAVLCEILKSNGETAGYDDLKLFALHHQIPLVSIDEIIHHRLNHPYPTESN